MLDRWKEESDDYGKSVQFWRQTFKVHRPCGPDLPLALRPEDIDQPRFLRKELRFPAYMWTRFSEKASSNGLTASAALLSLFGMVLRQWCSDRPFCINVPVSSRLPIHADVDRLIGDFTTTIFITFDGSNTCFDDGLVRIFRILDLLPTAQKTRVESKLRSEQIHFFSLLENEQHGAGNVFVLVSRDTSDSNMTVD